MSDKKTFGLIEYTFDGFSSILKAIAPSHGCDFCGMSAGHQFGCTWLEEELKRSFQLQRYQEEQADTQPLPSAGQPAQRSTICPCGINRNDCDYHR